ncbi:hypothetical protein ACT7DE_18580, partial [Bacillus paranthracis]
VTLKLKGALVQQSKLKSRFLERLEIGFFYDWNFLSVVNTHFPDATPYRKKEKTFRSGEVCAINNG